MLKTIADSKKPLLIVGGVLLASGVAYFWLRRRAGKTGLRNSLKAKTTFTKADVLNVYTRIRRNQYPLLVMLLKQHTVMQAQSKHNGITYSAKDKLDKLLINNPRFWEKKQAMEKKVFKWFGLSTQSVKLFFKFVFELEKADRDLIALKEAIEKDLLGACQGKPIDLSIELPGHITPELALKVYAKITFSSLMSDLALYASILEGPEFMDPYDRPPKSQRHSNYMRCMYEYTIKFEFNKSERYHEHHVFRAALFQFKQSHPKFEVAAEKVKLFYRTIQRDFASSEKPFEDIKRSIAKVYNITM